MKREDAIKTLKELWRETNDSWYEEVYNMAINALETDRKTESNSEFPNNCDTCKHNKLEWYSEVCDGCSKAHSNYEPKDEPSNSEKPNNCDTCKYGEDKHRYAHICNECGVGINNYEPKDEPTISKMEQVDEPQTERNRE